MSDHEPHDHHHDFVPDCPGCVTDAECRAAGTPLEARVQAVMGFPQGGSWELGQAGYEIRLDDWFTADRLRAIADAMEPPAEPGQRKGKP